MKSANSPIQTKHITQIVKTMKLELIVKAPLIWKIPQQSTHSIKYFKYSTHARKLYVFVQLLLFRNPRFGLLYIYNIVLKHFFCQLTYKILYKYFNPHKLSVQSTQEDCNNSLTFFLLVWNPFKSEKYEKYELWINKNGGKKVLICQVTKRKLKINYRKIFSSYFLIITNRII